MVRSCVPLFVVLSGALLLNPAKDVSFKELFGKRLTRLLIPLIIWGVIYILFDNYELNSLGTLTFWGVLKEFYTGPVSYHFWFLYMMVGLYLAYPIINLFIKGAKEIHIRYFIIIWFIANSVLGTINAIFSTHTALDLSFFLGYSGYFVLGYYLQNFSFSKAILNRLYLLGIAGLIISAVIPLLYSFKGHFMEIIENNFTPELPFVVTGLFLYVKNHLNADTAKYGSIKKIITSISKESYGIYIIHVFILDGVLTTKWPALYLNGLNIIYSIPIQLIITLAISYVVIRIIRLIPFSIFII